jgi:hypothetical protein
MLARRKVYVNDAAPLAGKGADFPTEKKGMPQFLFLVPLVPIFLMVLVVWKGKPDAALQSFTPILGVDQTHQQQQTKSQTQLRETGMVKDIVPDQITVVSDQSTPPKKLHETQFNPQREATQDFQLVKQDELIISHSTVVTAYFTVKSKHATEKYLNWMSNMLSLQDAMIIFSSPEMVETMQLLRRHAANRTVIIPFDLNQVELVQTYDNKFWQEQLNKDREKHAHQSYELFWIWLSKSFFVKTAIELNVFQSDIFMWSDVGCFRSSYYRDRELVLHTTLIPHDRLLQMAHREPLPPPYIWWNDKKKQGRFFYHSGSQMVAYKDTWIRFHQEFLVTVKGFIKRNMFIGDDQLVLQSTCLRVTSLCAYVPMMQIPDNSYFGLRYVLHFGGTFQFWYPPKGLPLERSDVLDPSLLGRFKPLPYVRNETILDP